MKSNTCNTMRRVRRRCANINDFNDLAENAKGCEGTRILCEGVRSHSLSSPPSAQVIHASKVLCRHYQPGVSPRGRTFLHDFDLASVEQAVHRLLHCVSLRALAIGVTQDQFWSV